MQRFFAILLLFFHLGAGAQPEHILHKNYAERSVYLDSVGAFFDEIQYENAAKQLTDLELWANKNKDVELALKFRLMKYDLPGQEEHSKNWTVGYLTVANEALRDGHLFVAADAYGDLAKRYWQHNLYSKSLEYNFKAYAIYNKIPSGIYPHKAKYQHAMAISYYVFKDYEKAKFYLLSLKENDTFNLFHVLGPSFYNTLAMAYSQNKQYDSALMAFYKIYNEAISGADYTTAAIAAGNIGDIYYYTKKYDSTIYWLTTESNIAEKYLPGLLEKNRTNSAVNLAEIYFKKKKLDSANYYIQKAFSILTGKQKKTLLTRQYLYKVYSQILAAEGKMDKAYEFSRRYADVSDSLSMQFDKSKIFKTELMLDSLRHEMEVTRLVEARKVSVLIRNGSIAFITMLSIIIVFMVNRRRLKHKNREEKAAHELQTAQIELENFTKSLQEKNRKIDQFATELEKIKTEHHQVSISETLLQLQQSTILTEEEWNGFRAIFEKVHAGYINRLKVKFPDLSPGDVRYIVLVKLNFDNKEMANILGVGTNAVRNSKYRLRKRFDIHDDESFDNMIQNI
jgi:tetratricopeptide (TPR) repeat protein